MNIQKHRDADNFIKLIDKGETLPENYFLIRKTKQKTKLNPPAEEESRNQLQTNNKGMKFLKVV